METVERQGERAEQLADRLQANLNSLSENIEWQSDCAENLHYGLVQVGGYTPFHELTPDRHRHMYALERGNIVARNVMGSDRFLTLVRQQNLGIDLLAEPTLMREPRRKDRWRLTRQSRSGKFQRSDVASTIWLQIFVVSRMICLRNTITERLRTFNMGFWQPWMWSMSMGQFQLQNYGGWRSSLVMFFSHLECECSWMTDRICIKCTEPLQTDTESEILKENRTDFQNGVPNLKMLGCEPCYSTHPRGGLWNFVFSAHGLHGPCSKDDTRNQEVYSCQLNSHAKCMHQALWFKTDSLALLFFAEKMVEDSCPCCTGGHEDHAAGWRMCLTSSWSSKGVFLLPPESMKLMVSQLRCWPRPLQ